MLAARLVEVIVSRTFWLIVLVALLGAPCASGAASHGSKLADDGPKARWHEPRDRRVDVEHLDLAVKLDFKARAVSGTATLRGKVLPVGGIKAKVLAAHRAGLKRVVLPQRNEADLHDVPDRIKENLEFLFATDMSEVIEAALEREGGQSMSIDRPIDGRRRGQSMPIAD